MAPCCAMICHQVTLSGDAEWPKVADAVIEAPLGLPVPGGFGLCLGAERSQPLPLQHDPMHGRHASRGIIRPGLTPHRRSLKDTPMSALKALFLLDPEIGFLNHG